VSGPQRSPVTDSSAQRDRLRVLHVTRNLPPLRGGMERLNLHAIVELQRQFDVRVVGPVGCTAHLPAATPAWEIAAKPLWRFFASALPRALRAALSFRPDIVLAGSGLAAPFAWAAARVTRCRLAVYVHGLDLIADHPVYRWAWLPFIRRADLCMANS